MKVLYVDDDSKFREQVKTRLEKSDYPFEVSTSSVERTLQDLEEEDHDAIVFALETGDKDGVEFLEEVREKSDNIPFILFTSKEREEITKKAFELGVDRYVRKTGEGPGEFDFLAQAIAQEVKHFSTKDEKKLQEAYFEQLFENSPEGIVLLDADDRVIDVNESFESIFGYERDDIKGEHINDLIVPEDKQDEATSLSESVLSGDERKKETVRKRKDGSRVTVSTLGYPIEIDGELVGVFGIYRDITQQKKREEKIKELYKTAIKMEKCESEDEAIEIAMDSAKEILDFKASSFLIAEDGNFVVRATIAKNLEVGDKISIDRGIAGRTYREKESQFIDDLSEAEEAEPTDSNFESLISIPVGEEGVFQALSYQKEYFDEFDMEMAETLISHTTQVLERIRSEERLKKREEKYRAIFESANDAIFTMKDYKFVDCNKKTEEIFEVESDEILNEHPWKFSPEEQPDGRSSEEKAKEKIDKAREEGPQFFEWVHEKADGTPIETEVSLNKYEMGEEEYVMAVVRDITERKKTKRALKESKEKIEKLHKIAAELEECKEEDEVYELTAEAAREILDFHDFTLARADEENEVFVVKKTLKGEYENEDRLPFDTGYLGKTYHERRSYLVKNLLEDEIAEPSSEDYMSAISVPVGDIGVFQAMSEEVAGFKEEDLELAETLLSHTNQVLKRIKSERQLREREQRFRNIFDHALVGIYRTTPDGELLTANPKVAEMMGYDSVEELKSKELSEIADTIDYSREEFKEIMEKEGRVEGFRGKHRLPDGTILHTIENAVAVRDENGEIKYYDGTMQDITELKKTREKLEESEKKYRAIFENTGTAMLIIDEEFTISLTNRKFEKLIGLFEGSVEGKSFKDYIVEEDLERIKRYHELRREDNSTVPNEYDFQMVTEQGDIKDIHITVNMIPETEKSVASLMDITEKKKIKKKKDHYGSLLKEVEDNLDILEGYTETLARKELDEEGKEQIEKIEKMINKNKRLIENI
ncbi:MAG: PAS domain S-box protein [Candidatus Thermoplasmatota archaeon]|nr:PAS domain S-box protein [Candidatus Thermoplasmatota archaeon]